MFAHFQVLTPFRSEDQVRLLSYCALFWATWSSTTSEKIIVEWLHSIEANWILSSTTWFTLIPQIGHSQGTGICLPFQWRVLDNPWFRCVLSDGDCVFSYSRAICFLCCCLFPQSVPHWRAPRQCRLHRGLVVLTFSKVAQMQVDFQKNRILPRADQIWNPNSFMLIFLVRKSGVCITAFVRTPCDCDYVDDLEAAFVQQD